MRILGPPSADPAQVRQRLTGMGATPLFVDHMLEPLWAAAVGLTVDPVGVVAQSYKETGGGRFAGQVKPQFYNTAGIKNRHVGLYPGVDDGDQPLAHARFASWDVGAVAHAQHVRAYSGWPVEGLIVDPRYWLVIGKHRCETWHELSGKWAPAADYGTSLVAIARRLQGVA